MKKKKKKKINHEGHLVVNSVTIMSNYFFIPPLSFEATIQAQKPHKHSF